MSSKKIIILILSVSIILGVVTRFYKLGMVPEGLYLDEAAQGYSAFSILQTGKDEFGKKFPVVFRSFTDFKTPVYIYFVVPLIPVFGLTKFAVRFPSFFFSILTIPLVYLLISKVTPKKFAAPIGLCTSFLLAISPWHILFGRTNFECNVALFFLLLGLYLFFVAREKPKVLILSAIAFAVAFPSYHAQRIITPLTLVIMAIKYRGLLLSRSHIKVVFLSIVAGLIISLPTLFVATTPGFLARATGLNIFSVAKSPSGYLEGGQIPFESIVNSRLFLSTKEFLSLYVSYFSPRNMFVLGDYGPRSSFPELPTFFLWQFPFYILGLIALIKNKGLGELRFLTIFLLLISPIPAALTRDPYSTIRSLQMVIPQTIVISLGLNSAYGYFRNFSLKIVKNTIAFDLVTFFLILTATAYSLGRIYSSVIVLNEYFRASEWNYGWEKVVNILNSENQNLPVIVDNARSEPYSQIIFFLRFDPETYQKENHEVTENDYYTKMDRNMTKKIGRITTRPIIWEKDLLIEQYLVGDELAISTGQIETHNLTLIEEVKFPNQQVAFRIVKTNP